MRNVTGYCVGLERIEFTGKDGAEVRRTRVHWFGSPLAGEGSTGFAVRVDSVDSKEFPREIVPNGAPVKCIFKMEDRELRAQVYGRTERVLLPTLRGVEVAK